MLIEYDKELLEKMLQQVILANKLEHLGDQLEIVIDSYNYTLTQIERYRERMCCRYYINDNYFYFWTNNTSSTIEYKQKGDGYLISTLIFTNGEWLC